MKKRQISDLLKKISIIMIVTVFCLMGFGFTNSCHADEEIEEWEESGTILLDKVIYSRKNRTLTVEITETSGEIAHEYELYMLIEGELPDAIGRYLSLGKILSILGIMTVDVNNKVKVIDHGKGKITIKDQELYFGSNEEAKQGQRVLIGVESLDENYNGKKSNLIELEIGEDISEQGAISIQGGGNSSSNSNTQSGSSGSGGSMIMIIVGIAMMIAGGALMMVAKKRSANKSTDKTAEIKPKDKEVANKEARKEKETEEKGKEETESEEEEEERDLLPTLEDKTVVVASKDEELINKLKRRHFLEVHRCEKEEIEEAVEENEPDLLILDLDSEQELDELLEKKNDKLAECAIALNVSDEILPSVREKLELAVIKKNISSYVPASVSLELKMVKLVLPILKPYLKSDESLEMLGKVAVLLGIPMVATIINIYVSGRDIKSNLEESEIGVSQTAAIIGDIASILGLDKIASVAGLVDDIDSIKSAMDKEAGANEIKNGVLGAKDIIDVVKEFKD